MLARLLTAVVLAAPARAVVLGVTPLSPVAEVRLAPVALSAPAFASPAVLTSAALTAFITPTIAYFAAGTPTYSPPTPANVVAAAAVSAAPAPDAASSVSSPARLAGPLSARRRLESVRQISARMRADAQRVGREFKTMEWRDGENYFGYGDRAPERIYRAIPGPNGRALLAGQNAVRGIPNGKRLPYVLTSDGAFDVGWPTNRRERGVKHLQIADGREVVFAGEITRLHGRLVIDLNSGTFSFYGMDKRWAYTPENIALLKDYASALLGEPVDVVSHFDGN